MAEVDRKSPQELRRERDLARGGRHVGVHRWPPTRDRRLTGVRAWLGPWSTSGYVTAGTDVAAADSCGPGTEGERGQADGSPARGNVTTGVSASVTH